MHKKKKSLKKNKKRGVFVTFEGPEGSGKTTHIKLLSSFLRRKKFPIKVTREPGGTILGEDIRNALLDPRLKRISYRSELFLYLACRSQIMEEVIKPNLVLKKIVLCDRFADATRAYQGFGRQLDIKLIDQLNKLLIGEFKPDLTVLIDIDPRKGLRRGCRRENIFGEKKDRLEKEKISFHKRVRKGYLYLAKKEPKRFLMIKGADPKGKNEIIVRQAVMGVIKNVLG